MEPPSAAVCAFINAYIESIDQLRVLLLLARQRERARTVGEISAACGLPTDKVLILLQRLISVGLMASAGETEVTFQYGPRAVEFDQMVQELIQLDDQMPVTLIRLVYARQSGSAQAFADAFRLRRP